MKEKLAQDNELLTAKEAAELIPHTSHQTVLLWARKGDIPSIVLPSGRRLFRRKDIEALLRPPELDNSVSAGISNELPLF